MKLVGYVRVSTAGQAEDGVSLDAQREKIAGYCKLYNHELVAIEADEGASGKTLRREGLGAALARLKAREAEGVIVAKLDRLTRSVRDLGTLLDDPFSKASLVSVSEQMDTSTAGGRLVLNVLTSVAQWEREAISERTSDALNHLKGQGVRLGRAPLGMKREGKDESGRLRFVVDTAEQATVDRILELRATGGTMRAIASTLDAEGFETKRGGKWHASTVRAVLARAHE